GPTLFPSTTLFRSQMLEGGHRGQHAAAAGGLGAALGTAYAKRLSSHDRRHRMAGVHADGVHHPGHDLGVGVDVGGRDVAVGPDHDTDLARIAAGEVLELVSAELFGIDDHPSLGAAVRNSHHGAFPRHPHGNCLDL